MQIRMNQFFIFSAGATAAAAIVIRRLCTIDILRIGNRHSQAAGTLLTEKQLGMTYPVVFYGLYQMRFYRVMTYNILKLHLYITRQR